MAQQPSSFMRWTSYVVILSMLVIGLPMQSAFAGIVETDHAISDEPARQDRAKINSFIDREDVLAQLQLQGVTALEAKARVNALTDDEAHMIAGKLDQLPSGGDFLGMLVFAFIVLLVTDILGYTDVFPFTQSLRR
jgi:hypothetical protein